MHRRVNVLLSVVLSLSIVLATPASFTRAQITDGATLTVLRGQVAVVRPDGSAVQPAPSGTVVRAGDEIRTLTKTGALITFYVGTEIEMGEETILVVERITVESGRVDISLKQALGTTLNRVQSLTDPSSAYRIDAGGATAVVRGTTFLMIGPVATAGGNIAAVICLDDCDGRTTFSGCALTPYTAFGVTVERGKVTSGCETAAVSRGSDYFNAGFEAITTFEHTFAAANDGNLNPGTGNLGREEGQRRADERRQREDRDDKPTVASTVLSACQVPGGGGPLPPGTFLIPGGASVLEGDAGTTTLNVPVMLFPAQTTPVTVNFATGGGGATAGVDYVATSGTLTFPPGSTTQNVSITVNGDPTPEGNETINITFSNPVGATLLLNTGLGRIIDDDTPIQISLIPGATGLEGDVGSTNVLTFIVNLSRPSTTPISVSYQTNGTGSATPGIDFTPNTIPQTLTIPPGSFNGTFTVGIIGDTAPEPNETVGVMLSNPSGGSIILVGTGTGTILDDDGPISVNIFNESVPEGCEGLTPMTISVQLTRAAVNPVSVNYQTANGTATAGSDYQATSGTLTFAPGQSAQTFTVQIIGDTAVEPDETFLVQLASATGAAIGTGAATATILNDD